jgi:hypothetical protein
MYSEKQNNKAGWKDKLEDFSNFPGEEMINKNEAWQKLHNRLREKPHNNKLIWYWLAAACLLLIFFVPKIINKKSENDLVKHISKQTNRETKIAVHVSQPAKTINKTEIVSAPIEKKADNNLIKKEKIKNDLKIGLQKNIPLALNNSKNNNNPVIINTPVIADTPLIVIAAAPVKRKLQVVHINEIENANEGMASSNSTLQQGNFNIAFVKMNQVNIKQTFVPRNYAGIIKIKISPQN